MRRHPVVISFPVHRVRPRPSRVVFAAFGELDAQQARSRALFVGSAALFTLIEALALVARLAS